MAALSLILMLYAPFEWWSLFVNVLTWPLIGVMFALGMAGAPRWLQRFPATHTAVYHGQSYRVSAPGGAEARDQRRMTGESLIGHRAADARIAVRDGGSNLCRSFCCRRAGARQQLPPAQYVLNSCRDRYLFAVGFCAALIAGRTSLLPPSRAPETLAQLATRYPDTLYLGEDAGGIVWHSARYPQ